jgi:hypothetical protein
MHELDGLGCPWQGRLDVMHDPGEGAAIGQTVPLFSTLFVLLLPRENLTLLQAVGGLIALLGGLIVSLKNEAQAISAQTAPSQEARGTDQAKTIE